MPPDPTPAPMSQADALNAAGNDADVNAGEGNVGDPVSSCQADAAASPTPAPTPIPTPTPPPPSCKVEVRANKLSSLGYYHMFVVFTDAAGKEYYLRGGPSAGGPGSSGLLPEMSGGSSQSGSASSSESSQTAGSNPTASTDSSPGGQSGGPWGYIVTEYGEYQPGTIDWDPGAKAVTVANGPAICSTYDELKEAFDGVTASKTRYNPLSTNSNATVFSTLTDIGITPQRPDDVWAPGYDTPISIP